MGEVPLLSLAIFLPAIAAVALAPVRDEKAIRWIAAIVSALVLGMLTAMAILVGNVRGGQFAYGEEREWIAAFGAHYRVGADGISLGLGMLTALLSLLAVFFSWDTVRERVKGYFVALLILETGMLGVFFALDLFLFYVFWEISLVPMYFLIGMWGGPRRVYAAIKFVLFTVAGSLLMLVAIVWVYRQTGTMDLRVVGGIPPALAGANLDGAMLPFLAFALAFAIKVPMFPFHTWLPDAHVEAPTAGSVILAGVLLKLGVYGFIRIAIPFFPAAAMEAAPWFLIVAAVGAVYGALMSMVQTDIKKLIAYSSVSHMGFVMLGLFSFQAMAAQGAVLQSINHGISTGALFLLVGVIYERSHVRGVGDFGGLARITPAFAAVFLVVTLSSIGLPSTNGFVGEFLILMGTFQSGGWLPRICVVAAGASVILGAVYMLGMYRRVFWGMGRTKRWESLKDLNAMEWAALAPLVVLIFAIGVQPNWLLHLTEPAWSWMAPWVAHAGP